MCHHWLSSTTGRLLTRANVGRSWGYVIYRTTYTTRADTQFPQLVDLLNSSMHRAMFQEYTSNKENGCPRTPYDQIWNQYRPVVMEDRAVFDGKSVDFIRRQFERWVEDKDQIIGATPRHGLCLVTDEESLQSLASAPSAKEVEKGAYDHEKRHNLWIKAVEACPDEPKCEPGFRGWMKCSILDLWSLWGDMDYNTPMGEMYAMRDKDSGVFGI